MKPVHFIVVLMLCVLACSCGSRKSNPNTVTIATAANMQFAMEELAGRFTKNTGIPCELILGSSGKLTAQIVEGAPYDLFVAANMKYPEEVARKGFAAGSPEVYARGTLVLWTAKEGITPSLSVLTTDAVAHIALANPAIAPYGKAAMEVLDVYGLSDVVADKLVYGESIAQANQFILSGAAEMGFTALSVVLSPNMQGRGRWVSIDSGLHMPIEQGVVLIHRQTGPSAAANAFHDFLFSAEAREVLKNFGYSVSEPARRTY